VIRGKLGIDYDTDLEPVIEETADLSQPLGEVWTDGLQAYRRMEHDHKIVVHDETYVSPEGIHINQVECLFSLVKPWLRKFRGLSKPGLEQSVRTYGFVRTLNLAGVPLSGLIDCFAVNVFR
jgi:transposase-like protein